MDVDASVVIPVFNGERTLGRCLEALERQDFPGRYEVLVVDDGSTDATPEMAAQFSVRYIRQEQRGPAAARNLGAQAARGRYLLFTDADCVPEPDWIRQMTLPFQDPEVVAVKGAYRTDQRSLMARLAQLEFLERYRLLARHRFIDMVDTYSAAYRREMFLGVGGFDPSFPLPNNEDTELSYRMSQLGYRMVFNPRAVVRHLGHPDDPWSYARLKFQRGYWRAKVYRRFPSKALRDTYTPHGLKLQCACSLLLLAALGALPLGAPGGWALAAGGILVGSGLPLMRIALREDPVLLPLIPSFLLLRGLCLALGALWGVLRR